MTRKSCFINIRLVDIELFQARLTERSGLLQTCRSLFQTWNLHSTSFAERSYVASQGNPDLDNASIQRRKCATKNEDLTPVQNRQRNQHRCHLPAPEDTALSVTGGDERWHRLMLNYRVRGWQPCQHSWDKEGSCILTLEGSLFNQ